MKVVKKFDWLRSLRVELQHFSEFLVFYFLNFFRHAVLGNKELYKWQPQDRENKEIEKKKKSLILLGKSLGRESPVRTWEADPYSMTAVANLHMQYH